MGVNLDSKTHCGSKFPGFNHVVTTVLQPCDNGLTGAGSSRVECVGNIRGISFNSMFTIQLSVLGTVNLLQYKYQNTSIIIKKLIATIAYTIRVIIVKVKCLNPDTQVIKSFVWNLSNVIVHVRR